MPPQHVVCEQCSKQEKRGNTELQAMRGWETTAQEYSQDDHSLLRVMARSASKVPTFPLRVA